MKNVFLAALLVSSASVTSAFATPQKKWELRCSAGGFHEPRASFYVEFDGRDFAVPALSKGETTSNLMIKGKKYSAYVTRFGQVGSIQFFKMRSKTSGVLNASSDFKLKENTPVSFYYQNSSDGATLSATCRVKEVK